MSQLQEPERARWPGLSEDFHKALMDVGASPAGRDLRLRAEARFMYAENKPFLLGPPQMIRAEWAGRLRDVVSAYHRCIERIVEASRSDARVVEALSSPAGLRADLEADTAPENGRVHIMRLDLLPTSDGGFSILETNANCPGGFVFSGICNRAWRELLEERGYPMPLALPHEEQGYMAEWVLDMVEAETGGRPDYLPLLREDGGNRFELTDFAVHLKDRGVETDEIDPRELVYDGGRVEARGRPVRAAYQKLGMQRFLAHRASLDAFVDAVRERAMIVQNGQRGRWVGDDKRCLAIVSDPDFAYLFDANDLEVLGPHVPWSRNASLLSRGEIRGVCKDPADFVLKRGLDTRGFGVIVGGETEPAVWETAVQTAVSEGWLVQRFTATTWIERDFDAPELQRHDIAAGAINGELTTLFMRSSGEMRVNMARTGRMHPLFMGG